MRLRRLGYAHVANPVLRRLLESGQYTSGQFASALDAHGVLASVGTTGDALDNAMAESFVDTFKTELIADRVWRTRAQLELAVVEYVGWFNHRRLHEALGDVPPVEFELEHALAAPSAAGAADGCCSALALRARAAQQPSDTPTTVL